VPRKPLALPDNYDEFLRNLKLQIQQAQARAAFSVNQELIALYWQIGREILLRQQREQWGSQVIEKLAQDLRREFPDMKGFSARNLAYMKNFAEAYPDEPILQQAAAKIPWFHNCVLLEKVKEPETRLWYIQQTIQNGWSRSALINQIDSKLFERLGTAQTNFEQTLPQPQSALAHEMLKNPYNFDFLSLGKDALERDLESALVEHIRDFLLELGVGFAFVGSQFVIQVSGREYRIDLLFYHYRLHCFVVVDLKTVDFEPEFSGKMNFYVSAVDDLLKAPEDNPSIGIILCKTQDQTIVEYALRDMNKPIGVSTYQLRDALPEQLANSLPTIEQLEVELQSISVEQLEMELKTISVDNSQSASDNL
jgi:predicted nuclease of restriction endonuclease-like (RecB) superfamily